MMDRETEPFRTDPRIIDQIAHALLDASEDERRRVLTDTLKKALVGRADLREPDLDPHVVAFIVAIYERIDEMRRSRGTA